MLVNYFASDFMLVPKNMGMDVFLCRISQYTTCTQGWWVHTHTVVISILVSKSENPEQSYTILHSLLVSVDCCYLLLIAGYVFLTLWSFCSLPVALRFTHTHTHTHTHGLQGASTSTKTPQTNTAMPMRLVQTNNATVDGMFWWPKVRLIALGTQIHKDNNDISSSVGTCGPGHTPYLTPGAHGSCLLSFCVAPDPPFVSIPNST